MSNEEPIEEKNWAVQISQYIKNPLLISGGRKFDLRVTIFLFSYLNPRNYSAACNGLGRLSRNL